MEKKFGHTLPFEGYELNIFFILKCNFLAGLSADFINSSCVRILGFGGPSKLSQHTQLHVVAKEHILTVNNSVSVSPYTRVHTH